ncbi:MAG TPA: alpha-amylase/4-alpha-glucanotransferase domain-containing protein [Longimicrobiales bacterium]|nr:alpha-amylase/4-alpha-glucanotransferase domain-containing protein [Longimicrobiales bacterium]
MSPQSRPSVVIHGHFYQPPREDPWTGRVPRQASAAPYHDWNQRIHDECYRAVVAARILDDHGRIAQVVNTLEWISWDAGPTLLEWMAREAPATYRRFLEADARSRERTGYGNAIATPYHHVILPLSSWREKVTEVRWGIADFRRRFGREPEGMWLPEAAVDSETLEVLAREGIAFTVLGPTQVKQQPAGGLPGRVELPGGRSITVFVYDGPMSHGIGFGELLRDSGRWLERVVQTSAGRRVLSMATDGETFGHHHRWGEMALAGLLAHGARRDDLRFEGFGAALARHPAREAIEIVEPSSWSCVHGVERWRGDCGCKIDPSQPTSQAWRTELRDVLDALALDLHARFEEEGGRLFRDPWAARDEYGAVQDADEEDRRALLERHLAGEANGSSARAEELLEMERDALRMMTSCAWFFDDVARLEPLQNLMYAAHALDLAGPGAEDMEARLVRRLETISSNDPKEGTAAEIWRSKVRGGPRELTRPALHDQASETRAVARALAAPSDGSVAAALAALDAAPQADVYEAQTAVVRDLARRDAPGPHLERLASQLGIATRRTEPGLPLGEPVRFVFGIHLHQPVGNFDEVFQSHVDDVYLPFLERSAARGFLPMALHVSGPLLEWLDAAGHRFLDVAGELVERGALELLLSGFYEPVLPALSREDRLEQIGWMREWLERRLGARAVGLWLTERVWEPGLPRDLAEAGVEFVLVDDRHFLVAGFERHELDRPWRTESEGRSVAVLPIDQRLRYLVPFRSPSEIGRYFRGLAAAGQEMVVLADDGEKFGGWPGTHEWVWKSGWLESFFDEMERLAEGGVLRLARPSDAIAEVPAGGLAYLPTASYHEMELWSLPPVAAESLERAEAALADVPGAASATRGGHWRNFLARYAESNRMHKKAQRLSELCRAAGDPPEARRAIGRAQCNDAYWHGVFGGLYLRHLRDSIWADLARAERVLRTGQGLEAEWLDGDVDGEAELHVHSSSFAAVVSARRGGSVTELTWLGHGVNLANTLTRRRESYHRTTPPAEAPPSAEETPARDARPEGEASARGAPSEGDTMPSIHELEEGLRMEALPPVDLDVRALFLDRVLPHGLDEERYRDADYAPIYSWARERFDAELTTGRSLLILALEAEGVHRLSKTYEISGSGEVAVTYRWDPAAFPEDAWFAPEISVEVDPGLRFEPEPAEVWRHDIVTVSKREDGLEESVQGTSITPRWPIALGGARIVLSPPA